MTREKTIQLYELLMEYKHECELEMEKRQHGRYDKCKTDYYITHMISKEIESCNVLGDTISFSL